MRLLILCIVYHLTLANLPAHNPTNIDLPTELLRTYPNGMDSGSARGNEFSYFPILGITTRA